RRKRVYKVCLRHSMLAVASALIRWGILQTCTQGVGSLTRRQSVFSGLSSSLTIPKNLASDIYASEGLKKKEAIMLLLPSAIGRRFQWNRVPPIPGISVTTTLGIR